MITTFIIFVLYGIIVELICKTGGGNFDYWILIGISIVVTLVTPVFALGEVCGIFDSWRNRTFTKVLCVLIPVILFVVVAFTSYSTVRSFRENEPIFNGTEDIKRMEKHPNTPVLVDDCYSLFAFDRTREKQIEYWEKEYKPLTKKEKKDGIVECRANLTEDWDDTMSELQSKYGEFKILGAKEVNRDGNYILQVKPTIKDYGTMEDMNKKKKEREEKEKEEEQNETVQFVPWFIPM